MRKTLEAISLAALALLVFVTGRALFGSHALPAQVPIHFNLSGQPDGWGSPHALLVLPVVALALCIFMSLLPRYPQAFNYPVRVTGENRHRLQAIAVDMILWLKAEVLCIFAWVQAATITAARNPGQGLTAGKAIVPASVLLVLATIGWHFIAMRRAAQVDSASS